MEESSRKPAVSTPSSADKPITPKENTWQDRMMGSPALLISILFHALLIGGVVMLYQHYRSIALQEAAEAAKIVPDPVEYPIQMDHKKKPKPSQEDPQSPIIVPPMPADPTPP